VDSAEGVIAVESLFPDRSFINGHETLDHPWRSNRAAHSAGETAFGLNPFSKDRDRGQGAAASDRPIPKDDFGQR
jgi:hypothetical protein